MNLLNRRPAGDPDAAGRVKTWAREALVLPDDAAVLVSELRCADDDCPDVETVIAVLGGPGAGCKFAVLKPLAEVTRDDVIGAARVPSERGA